MHKVLIVMGVMVLLFITGCGSMSKLDRILDSKNYIIVDVRTEDEYNEGHVKGAINIPYDTIDKNVDLDKDKTILVYCKSGKRSGIAYDKLTDLGFDVYDLGAYHTISLEKE